MKKILIERYVTGVKHHYIKNISSWEEIYETMSKGFSIPERSGCVPMRWSGGNAKSLGRKQLKGACQWLIQEGKHTDYVVMGPYMNFMLYVCK